MSYATFNNRIQKRLGQIGASVGPPFDAYRVVAGCVGDFPDGWQFIGSTNIFRYKVPVSKVESGVEHSELLYSVFFNASAFNIGDVFVCTDPLLEAGVAYGPEATILPGTAQINALALGWAPSMRVPTGVRIDRRVRVYRPADTPVILKDGTNYWNETNDNDMPLILRDGCYSFGPAGSGLGNWVPGGFMSVTRRSDYPFDKEPGIVRSLGWMAYLPPLPGYLAAEGDSLITEDGARYVMLGAYIQEVGLVGTQMIIDRKISQDG